MNTATAARKNSTNVHHTIKLYLLHSCLYLPAIAPRKTMDTILRTRTFTNTHDTETCEASNTKCSYNNLTPVANPCKYSIYAYSMATM